VYPSVQSSKNVLNSAVILRYIGLKEDAYLSYNDINTFIIIPASTSSKFSTYSFVHNMSKINMSSLLSFQHVNATLLSKRNMTALTKSIFAFDILSPVEYQVISVYPSRIPINFQTAVKIATAYFIPKRIMYSFTEIQVAFKNDSSCNAFYCEVELQLLATSCSGVSIVMYDSLNGGSKLSLSIRASYPASISSPSTFYLQSSIVLKITSYCTFTLHN